MAKVKLPHRAELRPYSPSRTGRSPNRKGEVPMAAPWRVQHSPAHCWGAVLSGVHNNYTGLTKDELSQQHVRHILKWHCLRIYALQWEHLTKTFAIHPTKLSLIAYPLHYQQFSCQFNSLVNLLYWPNIPELLCFHEIIFIRSILLKVFILWTWFAKFFFTFHFCLN